MCVVGQRVALPRRVARLYPAYGLYLYGEGLYAQETRALKLAGAPVLFLPGNAGSYKQGTCVESVIVIMYSWRFWKHSGETCCILCHCSLLRLIEAGYITRVLPISKLALWAQWP